MLINKYVAELEDIIDYYISNILNNNNIDHYFEFYINEVKYKIEVKNKGTENIFSLYLYKVDDKLIYNKILSKKIEFYLLLEDVDIDIFDENNEDDDFFENSQESNLQSDENYEIVIKKINNIFFEINNLICL